MTRKKRKGESWIPNGQDHLVMVFTSSVITIIQKCDASCKWGTFKEIQSAKQKSVKDENRQTILEFRSSESRFTTSNESI